MLAIYNRGSAFAYRVRENSYMIYFPFQQLYNRDLVLPKNIKHKLPSIVSLGPDENFDKDIFGTAWVSSKVVREEMYGQEDENIRSAEKKSWL